MIQHRRRQRSFADGLISAEVSDLWEPWSTFTPGCCRAAVQECYFGRKIPDTQVTTEIEDVSIDRLRRAWRKPSWCVSSVD